MCCLIWIAEWCSGRQNQHTSQLTGRKKNFQLYWEMQVRGATGQRGVKLWGPEERRGKERGLEYLLLVVLRPPSWPGCSGLTKSSQSVTYSLSSNSPPVLNTPPGHGSHQHLHPPPPVRNIINNNNFHFPPQVCPQCWRRLPGLRPVCRPAVWRVLSAQQLQERNSTEK